MFRASSPFAHATCNSFQSSEVCRESHQTDHFVKVLTLLGSCASRKLCPCTPILLTYWVNTSAGSLTAPDHRQHHRPGHAATSRQRRRRRPVFTNIGSQTAITTGQDYISGASNNPLNYGADRAVFRYSEPRIGDLSICLDVARVGRRTRKWNLVCAGYVSNGMRPVRHYGRSLDPASQDQLPAVTPEPSSLLLLRHRHPRPSLALRGQVPQGLKRSYSQGRRADSMGSPDSLLTQV